jgi:sugar phosphate isomerase/epimerase
MIISNEIGTVSKVVGDKKGIELFAKAGFDAWDFSMYDRSRFIFNENKLLDANGEVVSTDLIKYAKELKKISLDNGIICNQSHAPFPSHVLEIRDSFKKVLEMSAIVGAKICVIHPCNNYSAEENAQMYCDLLPYAKEFGVKIATENMWNWDTIKD